MVSRPFRMAVLLLVIAMFTISHASEYKLDIRGAVTGAYTVEANIETNLPDGAVLGIDLGLSGLGPQDVFIGTNFVRVPVSGGTATAIIDGAENQQPSDIDLPTGEYVLEASFHPRWKENRKLSESLGIDESISGSVIVNLDASGADRDIVVKRITDQVWVGDNIFTGTEWDYSFWNEKFGNVEMIPLVGEGNPDILKMYYVESIDVTLLVNVHLEEIVTWRMGRESD